MIIHKKKNEKKVLSRDSDTWILCAWDDCEKDGVESNKVVDRHHQAEAVAFVFCSERHKQLWLNSHISYGNLPGGSRGVIH